MAANPAVEPVKQRNAHPTGQRENRMRIPRWRRPGHYAAAPAATTAVLFGIVMASTPSCSAASSPS